MSLVMRKPVFGVSDQVRHKPGCTVTEDGYRLEISDLESRGIVLSKWRKQRCWSASWLPRSWSASLFSHMQKNRFSHVAAHMFLRKISDLMSIFTIFRYFFSTVLAIMPYSYAPVICHLARMVCLFEWYR